MKGVMGVRVGDIFETKNGPAEVLEVNGWLDVKIRFLDPEWVTTTRADHLRKGDVKNYMKPTTCGVGFPGVGPYVTGRNGRPTKANQCWSSMLRRCYEPRNAGHAINYADVTVHSDWHNYQNFAEWYHAQIDHFGDVDFSWHIDKDLRIAGNRQYGPSTCLMVPAHVNLMLSDKDNVRGRYPIGVKKIGKVYVANCDGVGRNSLYIGRFKTISEAQVAYWQEKCKAIRKTAHMYEHFIHESIREKLLNFDWPDAFDYYGFDTVMGLDVRK